MSYGLRNDAFLAANIGFCLLAFLEFRSINASYLSGFALATLLTECFLVTSLRKNYAIDIVSGLIFAHYLWILAERYSHVVDVHFFKIPLSRRKLLRTESCSKCSHPLMTNCDL